MSIFQKSVIKRHLENLDIEQVEKSYKNFKENYSLAKIEKIKLLKEEEYQDGFLRDIFVDVLGYTLKPDDNHNLVREFKNQDDGRKADGAILKNEKAIVVIELKSTKTKDLKSITEQAFNYKNNQPDCKYVITSNFQKLRFYIDYAHEFEEFDLFNLQKEDFELLYLILNTNSIFSDLPLQLKDETKFHELEVSNKLYNDYSNFKRKLFDNLIKNHPDIDKLILFKRSQKLLDRFLFILFAEDSGLLPPNSISRIIKRFEILKDEDSYKPIYDIFKQYFGYMNIGREGKINADDIPAYNGGLFYHDRLLDDLNINDEILIKELQNLSKYDFNTEVDVNILGHIFEHSLNEIEEITAEIEATTSDKTKSKRKKDGVFYTPKYITQFIVENTIGNLCDEKRKELEIVEIEFDGTYKKKDGNLLAKGKTLYTKLKNYKDWLLSLKIIDPACGSGAFLNQTLLFLVQEHKNIDDIIAELTNTTLRLFDTDKAILENNLFGVDINEESVEIAKLSLWLRTAQKGRKLSNLNNNIKCGNSLIDDPEFAGEKAFNWNAEFKEIMDNGGFDVVIGNPPYVRQELFKEIKPFLEKNYKCYNSVADLYTYFIEKGIKLMKNDSLFSFILPNKFLKATYGKQIRKVIKEETKLELIFDFDDYPVFEDATTYPIIFIFSKNTVNKSSFTFSEINKREETADPISSLEQKKYKVSYDALTDEMWNFIDENKQGLINKIKENSTTLNTLVNKKI
jgi:type I restriction-modification system DNA methylase subunit